MFSKYLFKFKVYIASSYKITAHTFELHPLTPYFKHDPKLFIKKLRKRY